MFGWMPKYMPTHGNRRRDTLEVASQFQLGMRLTPQACVPQMVRPRRGLAPWVLDLDDFRRLHGTSLIDVIVERPAVGGDRPRPSSRAW